MPNPSYSPDFILLEDVGHNKRYDTLKNSVNRDQLIKYAFEAWDNIDYPVIIGAI